MPTLRVSLLRIIITIIALLFVVARYAWTGEYQTVVDSLRAEAVKQGWTFTIDETPMSKIPLSAFKSLILPGRAEIEKRLSDIKPSRDLPVRFDWRELNGSTPPKDQGSFGTCWAHGTIGPLEGMILYTEGDTVDLSEQYLVSCNRDGWDGYVGGSFAHDYHMWKPDHCGGYGAVLEEDFPYTASQAPCNCPYPHTYLIEDWFFIPPVSWSNFYVTPEIDMIKQAIVDYGQVSCGVTANMPFNYYSGGVFNGCTTADPNHIVSLVGWDDTLGVEGVWIMRNSYGTEWGEDGYMYIEYGCSYIGIAGNYIVYNRACFQADTVFGHHSLEVAFQPNPLSEYEASIWAFGDGDSASSFDAVHYYDEPGTFTVSHAVVSTGGDTSAVSRDNLIMIHADTLTADSTEVWLGESFAVSIGGRNFVPLELLRIPIAYDGPLGLVFDSFSTAGCRAAVMAEQGLGHANFSASRITLKFEGYMAPGTGEIVRVYFTPTAGEYGQTDDIIIDGYDQYTPLYMAPGFRFYEPVIYSGLVELVGMCGDIDADGAVGLLDIVYLINFKYKDGPSPQRERTADVNADGVVNILDIICLINYKYKGGSAPECP